MIIRQAEVYPALASDSLSMCAESVPKYEKFLSLNVTVREETG